MSKGNLLGIGRSGACWHPSAARAQSAIAGTVKDASGAVMPGVTVEATRRLIEEQGRRATAQVSTKSLIFAPTLTSLRLRCRDSRPSKREGLQLPSDFTATVDATMKIGSLEESVTVWCLARRRRAEQRKHR
jgi:hypothetical protein